MFTFIYIGGVFDTKAGYHQQYPDLQFIMSITPPGKSSMGSGRSVYCPDARLARITNLVFADCLEQEDLIHIFTEKCQSWLDEVFSNINIGKDLAQVIYSYQRSFQIFI